MLPLVGGEAGEEYTAQDAASEVARLRARIEDLQRQLGRLEGRLELTERTESTLREDLERERRQSSRRYSESAPSDWKPRRRPKPWSAIVSAWSGSASTGKPGKKNLRMRWRPNDPRNGPRVSIRRS